MKLSAVCAVVFTLMLSLVLPGDSPALPLPLARIPVPEPAGLAGYVKDREAAVRLGKAFFWDMQAGSDGVTACATCHYRAGADPRLTNQLHPGPAVPPAPAPSFQVGTGTNYTLLPADFPFFQVSPVDGRLTVDPVTGLPDDPNTVIVKDANDVVGSQGIALAEFLAIDAGNALDSGIPRVSLLFGTERQVTSRNAPSVINAVFNYTNFWDGRAHNSFNGESPYGPLDRNAGIWLDDGVSLDLLKQTVEIKNASLASQATGPALDDTMMSFFGRTFPELGRKMLSLTPLGTQLVHPQDSVLGGLSRATVEPDGSLSGNPGLNTSYQQMIRDAFQDHLWDSDKDAVTDRGPFGQTEANFALFWGLSLQLYQATLVSDRTPFDRFLAGNRDALSLSAQNGWATFQDKCALCHSGSELTGAAVGSALPLCTPPDCNPTVFTNNTTHALIGADPDPETFAVRLSDAGFYNTGVRPTAEDPGRGGNSPVDNPETGLPFPLSFTRLALAEGLPFATPALPAGASPTLPVAVDGAFKVPGLRNVELTPPYFHNGSALTLMQVAEFYARGGNFPGNAELAGAMQPVGGLRGNEVARAELVDFLMSLTDDRVRNETAPFDHPELRVPSGDLAGSFVTVAATGGAPAVLPPGLAVDPFADPTTVPLATFTGTVAPLSTVEVQVNALPSLFAAVTGGAWSLTATVPVGNNTVRFTAVSESGGTETQTLPLTVLPVAVLAGVPSGGATRETGATITVRGNSVATYRVSVNGAPYGPDTPAATPIVLANLSDGSHTVRVLAADAAGNRQPEGSPTEAAWVVKATPPVLTIAPVASPTNGRSQTIGGTVELGSIPQVIVAPPAAAGAVLTVGGDGIATWSCTLTNLAEGANPVTVVARDFVFNTTTAAASIAVDTVAPALLLDPVVSPARGPVRLVSGSVEAGLTPQLTLDGVAVPVTVEQGGWSAQLSGLAAGDRVIAVSATDAAGNATAVTAGVTIVLPDGNIKGTGSPDISDALTALRIAVGLVQPTPLQLLHGDVAPLVDGVPAPDDRIEIADALAILRKVVGLQNF